MDAVTITNDPCRVSGHFRFRTEAAFSFEGSLWQAEQRRNTKKTTSTGTTHSEPEASCFRFMGRKRRDPQAPPPTYCQALFYSK